MQRSTGELTKLCILLMHLVLSLGLPCRGQTVFTRPLPLTGDYKIQCMGQDNYGFLWLGTDKGIVIYNGYDEIAIPQLRALDISCLKVNHTTVYAGTKSGHVYMIDTKDHQLVGRLPSFTNAKISDLEVVKNKEVWVATYGDGVFTFQSDSLRGRVAGLKSRDIYDLEAMATGSVYIASDQGIEMATPFAGDYQIRAVPNLPDYIIVKLCQSTKGTVVAATYDRQIFEVRPDLSIHTLYPNLQRDKNHSIYCTDGRLIIHSGAQLLEWKKDKFMTLRLAEMTERISTVYVDKENNIWMAGGKSSLYKSGVNFIQFEIPQLGDIQAMEFDGSHFYLGTAGGVFVKSEHIGGSGKWLLKNENITAIRKINERIWIGTFSNGMYVYNKRAQKVSHVGRLLETDDNTVLDIEVVATDKVEVSTLAGIKALAISPEGDPLPGAYEKQVLLKAYVYDVFRDQHGGVWYGKDRNGLTHSAMGRLTDWKEIVNIKDRKTYRLGSVFSIAAGRAGELYFASSNLGLVRNRDGLWDILPQTFSIKNQIVALNRLNDQYLLVIRNHSVEVLELATGHILPFSLDMAEDSGITFLNNYSRHEGDCYFAIGNKLVRFSPGAALDKKHPITRLDKVEVNLETIQQTHRTFRQHENNLRFTFTAGWLTNPSAVQYAYKLEGFDSDWRLTGDRVVSYPHLNPGHYTFKVRATENKTFYDEPVTSYAFEITTAFYATWWFYTLLAAIAILSIWGYQRRRRKLELLRSELARIKTEAELINLKSQLDPHFLFNTFNTLIGLIEEDPARGVKFTENLTQFFRLLSQSSQKELIALSEEIQLVETYIAILKERFGKNISILIQPEVYQMGESAQLPPVALQMLIENAVKHNEVSKAKPLTITLSISQNYLVVSNVKNPKNAGEHSLGIGNKNIFERYRLMGLPLPRIVDDAGTYNFYLPIIKRTAV